MQKTKTFFIQTYGCIQNQSDSERIKAFYQEQAMREVDDWKIADLVIINTCIVRESAENRAFGLVNKIDIYRKEQNKKIEIIVTGCLPGVAHRVTTAAERKKKVEELYKRFPQVDKFLPTEEISFWLDPIRDKKRAGMITISTGCNNFCSFCIVPMARGREKSRPMNEILEESSRLITDGFEEVILIGQNVNSYGNDLVDKKILTKNMGKTRFTTLFPELLENVAKMGFKKVSFVSSNPWDFSDDLIDVIAKYPNINRTIHLPVQSGDDEILGKMKRAYTAGQYLDLIDKIREKVVGVEFTTDVIIGFCGESEQQFQHTIDLCNKVGFKMVYLNKYSPRKGTFSAANYPDNVPSETKHKRWLRADIEINHFQH